MTDPRFTAPLATSATSKPFQAKPPSIPKQKLPGWIRWPIRVLLYPWVMLDLAAQAFIYRLGRSEYKVEGACKMRGRCCHHILLDMPRWKLLGKVYLWYFTEIQGFYMKRFDLIEDDGMVIKVFGCRYLKDDGLCGHHILRPTVCRKWPRRQLFGKPPLFKGCGYTLTPRK